MCVRAIQTIRYSVRQVLQAHINNRQASAFQAFPLHKAQALTPLHALNHGAITLKVRYVDETSKAR